MPPGTYGYGGELPIRRQGANVQINRLEGVSIRTPPRQPR